MLISIIIIIVVVVVDIIIFSFFSAQNKIICHIYGSIKSNAIAIRPSTSTKLVASCKISSSIGTA